MSAREVTDDDLYALPPVGRRVVRLMAAGGWTSGSPGTTAVEQTCASLGLSYYGEQVRGEPRAFWSAAGQQEAWDALAARLDALPRRRRSS